MTEGDLGRESRTKSLASRRAWRLVVAVATARQWWWGETVRERDLGKERGRESRTERKGKAESERESEWGVGSVCVTVSDQ